MDKSTRITAGLDLGSTKAALAVVQQFKDETPELIGFSSSRGRFLKGGIVVNLEMMQDIVAECISGIRSLTQMSIPPVSVNISSQNLKIEDTSATIEFRRKTEIKPKHVRRLMDQISQTTDADWKLVHSTPRHFILDGQAGIASPIGMECSRLTVDLLQIFVPARIIENIIHAVSKCRLEVHHLVVDPLPALEALTTVDERELGVWLIDIGGASTSLVASHQNILNMFNAGNCAGDLVTSDIAIGLKTPIREAERLKIEHGCAIPEMVAEDMEIRVPLLGGNHNFKTVSNSFLAEIINSRMEEIIQQAAQSFDESVTRGNFSAGIILTGGGSQIRGTVEIAEKHLDLPVIQGSLRNIQVAAQLATAAEMATSVGLALHGLRYSQQQRWGQASGNTIRRSFKYLFSWLGGHS